MGKHLDQLRLDSQDTQVGSLTKPTEAPFVGFVSAWGVGSPAEKASGSAIQAAIVAEIEAEQALVNGNRDLIVRFEKKIDAAIARVWGEAKAKGAA